MQHKLLNVFGIVKHQNVLILLVKMLQHLIHQMMLVFHILVVLVQQLDLDVLLELLVQLLYKMLVLKILVEILVIGILQQKLVLILHVQPYYLHILLMHNVNLLQHLQHV